MRKLSTTLAVLAALSIPATPALAGSRNLQYQLENILNDALQRGADRLFNNNVAYGITNRGNSGIQKLSNAQVDYYNATCSQYDEDVVQRGSSTVTRIFCNGDFVGYTAQRRW